jgi:hypothetical protein
LVTAVYTLQPNKCWVKDEAEDVIMCCLIWAITHLKGGKGAVIYEYATMVQ